jgi:hypothetical protein
MEMLGEELSKPAHSAMRHNITGIVEAALRTSASAGEDTVYDLADSPVLDFNNDFWQLPRSSARCTHGGIESRSGRAAAVTMQRPNVLTRQQGWGVFALEYRVDGPLVAILDAGSQKLYVITSSFD